MVGLEIQPALFLWRLKTDLKERGHIEQVEGLVKGLLDTMYYIETAEQDKLIPITILCPFETVLEKIYSLVKEITDETV